MRVPLLRKRKLIDTHMVVRMQIQHDALDLRRPAVVRDVHLGRAVNGRHSVADFLQLLGRDEVGLVQDDHVRVGDLQMGHAEDRPGVGVPVRAGFLCILAGQHGLVGRGLVEQAEDVLRVDEGHDAVEVNGATEAVVNPEQRGDVARVGEAGRLEEDVVEGAAAFHEGFDGHDAGVSISMSVTCRRNAISQDAPRTRRGKETILDRAADAAIPHVQPLSDLLAVLVHR